MKKLNFASFPELKHDRPEKIIQFGEGNFIRAFIDWMVHEMNEQGTFNGSAVAVQPTPHGRTVGKLNPQDGLFTVILRGIENGAVINKKEIISSVSRGINPYTDWAEVLKCAENPAMQFVFSNTTEAGLVYNDADEQDMNPPLSFPAKLTLFLHHRWQHFGGAADKGMYIIPCELLEDNGKLLKEIIFKYIAKWQLPQEFADWVETNNKFYNTLVDRVVSGYPKDEIEELTDELGYEDALIACGEPFHFLAIEGDTSLNDVLPLVKSGLNVVIEPDITKYRQRKVRLLNGGHTANVPASFLAGLDTVVEMMNDEVTGRFACRTIKNVLVPSVSMDAKMLNDFADAVIERFQNPFIKHQLQSILLNCTSKFKARVLPSILEYKQKFGVFPQQLSFAFAAYIYLYKTDDVDGGCFYIQHNGTKCELKDDAEAVAKLTGAWKAYDGSSASMKGVAAEILGDKTLWDADLSAHSKLVDDVAAYLAEIEQHGTKCVMQKLIK